MGIHWMDAIIALVCMGLFYLFMQILFWFEDKE